MIDIESLLKFKKIKKSVLVIGDVMIDEYHFGEINRISPEFPVPVFNYGSDKIVLGGAANVAANLKAARADVSLMAVIGDDDWGKKFIKLCEDSKINTDLMAKEQERITTVKTRLLNQSKTQVLRIDREVTRPISSDSSRLLLTKLQKEIQKFDIIILSDYNKGMLTQEFTQSVIELAKKNGKKVLVDVKDKNPLKYAGASIIKPNLKELQAFTGTAVKKENEILGACNQIIKTANIEAVLVTLGADGMMYAGKNQTIRIPSEAREVFDVTGAGDTVLAYFGAALAGGMETGDAMKIANVAAGIKVERIGTAAVSIDDLIARFLAKNTGMQINKKIVQDRHLFERPDGKKIVFTNGCFDILHYGHISYLKQAKDLGDILIVGVNTDESVQRLKGKSRPIVPLDERMAMLAGMEFIDYVFSFSEDTPLELIKAVQPDVLVKGADYEGKEVVGQDVVLARGGSVQLLPYVENKSTTNIVQKIIQIYKEEEQRGK